MMFFNSIKDMFRPARDIIFTFVGYLYDFIRYFKYAGWRGKNRREVRDFRAAKIYHRLEKSLSFRRRDSNSGWGAAADLVKTLRESEKKYGSYTCHERIAIKVLADFVAAASNEEAGKYGSIIRFLEANRGFASDEGGVVSEGLISLQRGKLQDPEGFFLSRFSVRDFDSKEISNEDVERAIKLALKSPSVCNRRASFVYCIYSRAKIDSALSLQNGNRGFGHQIPCLLILCSDISAFDTHGERYQQWIDGGMFSMSIVWALHSLGIGSCCLNWSKGPLDDVKLRRLMNIKDEHTILMMLAVGLPREDLKACYSARLPVADFYEKLD